MLWNIKLVRDFGRDVFPLDPGPDTLTVIDLDEARVLATVPVQNSIVGPPQAVALSPDGSLAVVAAPTSYDRAAGVQRFADVLQVVQLRTEPPAVETIPIGAHPQSVAFTPDGARLLATTVAGTVLLFDVADGAVELRQRLNLSAGSLSGLAELVSVRWLRSAEGVHWSGFQAGVSWSSAPTAPGGATFWLLGLLDDFDQTPAL